MNNYTRASGHSLYRMFEIFNQLTIKGRVKMEDTRTMMIKEILMERDGSTASAADELIDVAIRQLNIYLSTGNITEAENVCEEFFNLEPDYLPELTKLMEDIG